jgi:hypothetical protein
LRSNVLDIMPGRAAKRARSPLTAAEQLVGRLIFAAGVTRTPLARFYFAMKVARREANKLERGEAKPDDVADVPPSVQALLREGRAVSLPTLAIPMPRRRRPSFRTRRKRDGAPS